MFKHIAILMPKWEIEEVIKPTITMSVYRHSDVLGSDTVSQLYDYARRHYSPDRPGGTKGSLFSTGEKYVFTKEAILAECVHNTLITSTFSRLSDLIENGPFLQEYARKTDQFGYSFFMVVNDIHNEVGAPNKFHCDRLNFRDSRPVDYSFIYRVDDPRTKIGDGLLIRHGDEEHLFPYSQNGLLGFHNPSVIHAGAPYRCTAIPPDHFRVIVVVMLTLLGNGESVSENPEHFYRKIPRE